MEAQKKRRLNTAWIYYKRGYITLEEYYRLKRNIEDEGRDKSLCYEDQRHIVYNALGDLANYLDGFTLQAAAWKYLAGKSLDFEKRVAESRKEKEYWKQKTRSKNRAFSEMVANLKRKEDK